jgi:predicted aminopeptidase
VDVVGTVLHESAHRTLYVRNATPFDESFAMFVGYRGAEAFFRARGDTAAATRAGAMWRDEIRLSAFYTALADTLTRLYDSRVSGDTLAAERQRIFADARAALEGSLGGNLEVYNGPGLARRPLNNATIIAARIYRDRLGMFENLYERTGGVRAAVAALRAAVKAHPAEDPYAVLEGAVRSAE